MMNNSRIFYYDLLRVFAIFCIISCHVFARIVGDVNLFNTPTWYFGLLFNTLRDVGVCLFVALSGALLINKKDSVMVFIKKRISRVVLPYVFWICIFIIFALICMQYDFHFHITIKELILTTVSFTPSLYGKFYWFVPMILTVYVVILIINKLNEYNDIFFKLSLALSIIFLIIFNLNLMPPVNPVINYVYYSIYAVFGYYAANHDFVSEKLSEDKIVIIFFLISVICYLLEIYITASNSIILNKYSNISQLSILNVCFTISVFIFVRYSTLSNNIFNRLYLNIKESCGKIIYSISNSSYGIYLSHMIVLISFRRFLKPLMKVMPLSVYSLVLLIITLILSWMLVSRLKKIPVLDKMVG